MRDDGLHKTAHAFHDALDGKVGWDAMQAAEAFQEKNKDKVLSSHCDDSSFMGSDFYFVVHATDKKWMGVSGYYIPQNADCGVPQFFLYPGHVDSMIKALTKIKEMQDKYKEIE